MQRGAAAEKADAESLRPISAESASCPNFPAKRNKRRDSNPQGWATSRAGREVEGGFSGMSQKSTS